MDRAADQPSARAPAAANPYALTRPAGQSLVRRLDRQVREPRREFPEFLGAVSHLGVLGSRRAAEALRERAGHSPRGSEKISVVWTRRPRARTCRACS